MFRSLLASIVYTLLCGVAGSGLAQETRDPEDGTVVDLTGEFLVETVAEGLDNPCGLAIRSGSRTEDDHDLYFAESGAGRIVAAPTEQPDQRRPAIVGFPTGPWDLAGGVQVGPLDTLFLTPGKLAVGYGGGERGPAAIRVFLLSDSTAEPLAFDQLDHEVVPSSAGGAPEDAVYQFFGLTNNDNGLLVAGGGDSGANWILKATINKNVLSDLQRHIDGKTTASVARPMAVVVDSRSGNGYLAAGHIGEPSAERDSALAFYAPGSGRLAAAFAAGVYDLVDLAYCPASGNLYAVDAAWHDEARGGVYRLDAKTVEGRQQCEAVRIAECERPTSLAFTPAGTALYVTTFGPAGDEKNGQLLKITGPF